MAMISNMKATGRSAEETEAALTQLFLSCPMTNPEAEEVEVNVDEFEHTKVEQRARRDQQRMLAALARHRDPEVQREGNDVSQAAFQSPYAHKGDDATSGPTPPARVGDGTDVGGTQRDTAAQGAA